MLQAVDQALAGTCLSKHIIHLFQAPERNYQHKIEMKKTEFTYISFIVVKETPGTQNTVMNYLIFKIYLP